MIFDQFEHFRFRTLFPRENKLGTRVEFDAVTDRQTDRHRFTFIYIDCLLLVASTFENHLEMSIFRRLFFNYISINLLWLRGKGGCISPKFLFFEFLIFGIVYHTHVVHGYKALKILSDRYWNIDIYAETDMDIYEKLKLGTKNILIRIEGGVFDQHFYFLNF